MFRALAAVSMILLAGTAQACLFARNAQPKDWDQWAQALFAADVTGMQEDRARALDVITLRVVETFKGPQATTATLQIPANMWAGCKLERPQVGSHVLGALNANGDALVVPLSVEYGQRLREALRPNSGPAPTSR
ncbi:MAG TPA: hypothetical protein VIV54_01020 [Burkholderiales bacterium]